MSGCAVCSKNVGLGKIKIADKQFICKECYKQASLGQPKYSFKNMKLDDVLAAIEDKKANDNELGLFQATKKVGAFIEFDDNRKKWLIPDSFLGKKINCKVYDYQDIVSFELLEDGESITKGGLGKAIAGGILLGGVGAVVGGVTAKRKTKAVCNSLKIKITINNMNNPVVYVNFVIMPTKKDKVKYFYTLAQDCLSTLQLICDQNEQHVSEEGKGISKADEIVEYKKLLDQGIISNEEFNAKKKQLLGL